MNIEQIDLTESLQEIGKLHCHFVGDIKLTSMLDLRMRDLFTVSIYAFGSRKRINRKFSHIFKYALYKDANLRFLLDYPEVTFYIDARKYFNKYKTEEFIVIDKKEKIKTLTEY